MQKITPHLWFDNNAEEAVIFYISLFPNSKGGSVARYGKSGAEVSGRQEGSVMTVAFQLNGQDVMALNGGPLFKFTPAISFFVHCKTADEVDALYEKLSEGGKVLMELDTYPFSERYSWVQDRYGVSWQLMLRDAKADKRPFIVPSLLFVGDVCGKAEEATDVYLSIFNNAERGAIARYPQGMEPDKEGSIMFTDFTLEGQWFAAMDSAHKHDFGFNEAISFMVDCKSQEEIDYYWEKLSEGGDPKAQQCGWLKDRFGVSWQIVPSILGEMMESGDSEKAERVMKAMLSMKKIDVEKLKQVAQQ